jgi:RNA polymerase sigma factor FliA
MMPVRDQLITQHADLVRRIAKRMSKRCPDWVTRDDLVAAGMVGLVEAAARYDSTRTEPFGAFAEHRIRGAMIDELRRSDIMPRRARQTARQITTAIRAIELVGEDATDERIATALGVSLARYRENFATLAQAGVDEFDETRTLDHASTPLEDQLARRHLVRRVRDALTELQARELAILNLHYVEEQTFAQIGVILGVTPSRVCQVLQRAIGLLRSRLTTLPS